VVIAVHEWKFPASDGEIIPHRTIVYVPADRHDHYRRSDRCWINECVAVDGRVLMLFKANTDEVVVVGVVASSTSGPFRSIRVTPSVRTLSSSTSSTSMVATDIGCRSWLSFASLATS
jgi:hypothetical protein